MIMLVATTFALSIAAQAAPTLPAPPPPPAPLAAAAPDAPYAYLMVRCIGSSKSDEYRNVMMETTAKTMQVRADEGDIAGWIFARQVLPSGSASTCDFMQMNLYRSFPPQRSPIDPYLVKAGLKITRAEWYAKLGPVSRLDRVELWRGLAEVGRADRGQFMRIDYLKVPPARRSEWAAFEKKSGKALAAAKQKSGDLAAWYLQELIIPGGTAEPYNARTVTVFPSWSAIDRPEAHAAVLSKALPRMTPASFDARADKLRDLARSELFEIIEVVRPAAEARPRP